MKSIRVVEFLENPVLLAGELGDHLEEKIKETLKGVHCVEVDFSGARFISTAFFNRAFGQLCIDMNWPSEKFHKAIKISGLEEDDIIDLDVAIDNAQLRRKLTRNGVTDLKEYFQTRLPA